MDHGSDASLPRRGTVAVLGLGRMGSAIAARLSGLGYDVRGWNRTQRLVPGGTVTIDAGAALADADVVVLALFDAAACRDVLGMVANDLRPGTAVVNTSTVGASEAAELADLVEGTGACYVHAPVLGSVPAARTGTLRLLVGASSTDAHGPASGVLADLGEALHLGDPATAASAKLLANGVLGDAVRAVHHGLARSAELGLGIDQALRVLEETPLGGLVAAKRPRLAGDELSPADFTVAALAKDLTLLATAAPSADELAAWVTGAVGTGRVRQDQDVATLCVPRPPEDLPHQMTCAPDVAAASEVLAPLVSYVTAHATGDPGHHRAAFAPGARIEGHRDGAYVSWTLDEYCRLFDGRPAPDEATRTRRVEEVFVAGDVATARMTLRHGPSAFDDLFLLARRGGAWKIVNKVFHRAVEQAPA